jgi:outer membrane protein with beta-barrel domain
VLAWPPRTQEGSRVPKRSTARTAVVAALAVLIPAAASAGEPRRHDGGFFLRLAPGYGYARTAIDEDGDRLALKGASANFDAAIGAMVKKNFAVHATLGGWALIEPTIEFNGAEEVAKDASATVLLIGAGFTYYLGPSNTYLTASVGASVLSFEFEGETNDSDTGVAFDVGVGKEWWVGDRWGLGLSGTAGYHSIPPGDATGKFKGPSFAVRFSATFN